MQRNIETLKGREFDIIVVGGGIYGACCAWDATLRGLSVAVIEKNDFGSATSSNSLKIIHGGLRYLQHADFKRMRESITERKNLMRIAPHLVSLLPCIMPTYGHGIKGKEVMSVALAINDLVGFDRNGLPDPEKHMPRGRVISRDECLRIVPGVEANRLTGGAVWYDCQVRNSERLLLSFLRAAANAGAVPANYVEMTGFRMEKNRVTGVHARDNINGQDFDIHGRLVINSSGPWLNAILTNLNGHAPKKKYKMSAAMNLVVRKKLFPKFAVGISSKAEFRDSDAVIKKGSRLFFITPWREYSLIGTTHVQYDGDAHDFRISEEDIQTFILDINAAYPPARVTRNDVCFFYGGLLPEDESPADDGNVRLLKSYKIIDHQKDSGLEGLLSVVSVKYTTARDVAENTVDCALAKLGRKHVASRTSRVPVFGGEIENVSNYLNKEKARAFAGLSRDSIEHLVMNYGSKYPQVVTYISEQEEWRQPLSSEHPVLAAEVIHAVREEMALKLSDVVRRRTELGSAGHPGNAALRQCAKLMSEELGWDADQIENEIAETEAIYVPRS